VHNYLNTQRFEKFYVIIPLALAFTLSIVPVITGDLGYDEKEVSCWYKNLNTTRGIVWEWATFHGWIVLSVFYCVYSIITIVKRLYEANKFIEEMNRSLPNNKNSSNNNKRNSLYFFNKNCNNSNYQRYAYERQLMVNRAVKRIVLYPVVPVITFLFNISAGLLFFTSSYNRFFVQMLSNVGLGLQGFLNAVAFSFDPAMKTIWSEVFGNNNDVVDIKEKINNAVISGDSNTIVVRDENINNIIDVDQSIGYDNVSLSAGELGNNNNSNDDDDNDGITINNDDDNNISNDHGYGFNDMTVTRLSRMSKESDEKYIITLL
jgi:hypothetical protein